MTRLAWGTVGSRYFNAGVDRGVLYVKDRPGVPWNGIQSINEAPTGGEPVAYWVDGYKYLNVAAKEEFKATLSAYFSPEEFDECDGTKSLGNGLFAMHQRRLPFGLAYRTLVGNDVASLDAGYKINLVYNALAAPSTRENTTMSDSTQPTPVSWSITTKAPKMVGLRPTAHFVIDSRITPAPLLEQIEAILYGSDGLNPRLPEISEIVTIFDNYVDIVPGYGSTPYGRGPYGR